MFHGRLTSWHENGQKASEEIWKNGELDGLKTTWHENGQESEEATFKDGELISEKKWDRNGNPVE